MVTSAEMYEKWPLTKQVGEISLKLDEQPNDFCRILVGVTLIEDAMRSALEREFVTIAKPLRKHLFDGGEDQPPSLLSSFWSKIVIAEALGMIGHDVAKSLHVIRSIRNAFAHPRKDLTFEDPEIKAEIGKLFPGHFSEYHKDKPADLTIRNAITISVLNFAVPKEFPLMGRFPRQPLPPPAEAYVPEPLEQQKPPEPTPAEKAFLEFFKQQPEQ